jgi:hypothetical protein
MKPSRGIWKTLCWDVDTRSSKMVKCPCEILSEQGNYYMIIPEHWEFPIQVLKQQVVDER